MGNQSIFDETYPNIAWWVQDGGWMELGADHYSNSLIRVLDEGGMLWEGDEDYESVAAALAEADAFVGRWREKNGY